MFFFSIPYGVFFPIGVIILEEFKIMLGVRVYTSITPILPHTKDSYLCAPERKAHMQQKD